MTDAEKFKIALQSLQTLRELPAAQQEEFKTTMRAQFKGNESGTAYIDALIQAAGI